MPQCTAAAVAQRHTAIAVITDMPTSTTPHGNSIHHTARVLLANTRVARMARLPSPILE